MSASDELPILYSFRRCPYAMRARLALLAAGQRCELREIVLRDKAPEFLAVSPKGTVPVVVLPDGRVIEESLDIMLWALAQHDPEGLLQSNAGLEANLALIRECDGPFKQELDTYKYAPKESPEIALAARERGLAILRRMGVPLETHAYLTGDAASLADIAIFPFVRQFANVDRGWFDGAAGTSLVRWLDGFLNSERFERAMKKYPKWQHGDAPVLFG